MKHIFVVMLALFCMACFVCEANGEKSPRSPDMNRHRHRKRAADEEEDETTSTTKSSTKTKTTKTKTDTKSTKTKTDTKSTKTKTDTKSTKTKSTKSSSSGSSSSSSSGTSSDNDHNIACYECFSNDEGDCAPESHFNESMLVICSDEKDWCGNATYVDNDVRYYHRFCGVPTDDYVPEPYEVFALETDYCFTYDGCNSGQGLARSIVISALSVIICVFTFVV